MKAKITQKPKVVVIQKALTHYRKPFFEQLRKKLDELGIELVLVCGEPDATEGSKKDLTEIPWAHKIKNRTKSLFGKTFYWQPCFSLIKNADLIIVEQANKLLINYYLWILNLFGVVRLAFWGHGKNFQTTSRESLSEKLKRFMSNKVYWWFAYNDLAAEAVKTSGFPERRITVVQNAIDTRFLIERRALVSSDELEDFRLKTGIKSKNVGVYSGGMYTEKRLNFLIKACQLIKGEVPDFEMVFLGAGPDEALVMEAAEKHSWIHYEGPKFDDEKILYFMLSKLLLMPGLVGLAVLDAFALGVPLLTTNVSYHSPEIEYLENGMNGRIIEPSNSPDMYAKEGVFLLKNEAARQILVEGCRTVRDKYTIENMAAKFSRGVRDALKLI